MGGTNPAVLGLLCLLFRAVLPGFAQEVSTNQSAVLGTEVPAAATISSIVDSPVPRISSSAVSEVIDITGGGKANEMIAVTVPPPSEGPSTITVQSEPAIETSAITEAPQEVNSINEVTTSSQAYTDLVIGGLTVLNLTQAPPTTLTASVMQDATTGTPSSLTETPPLPSTPAAQMQNNTETPPGSNQPAAPATAVRTFWTSDAATTNLPISTAVATAQPTSPATQTARTPHTSRAEVQRDNPSVMGVEDHKVPGFHSGSSSNPLFVMIVSVFTIMVVMVVVAVGFHRYKKRNRRTDFRRLQDLPMDDMMEDTPLALYSY